MKLARYEKISSLQKVKDANSLHEQIKKTNEWKQRSNHIITKDYVDESVCAYQCDRKAFQQLLGDLADNESQLNLKNTSYCIQFNFKQT